MTDKQQQKLVRIIDATVNRYISETESYIALINLIDEVKNDNIIDIGYE